MKKVKFLIILLTAICLVNIPCLAHSVNTNVNYSAATTEWDIKENTPHLGSNYLPYKIVNIYDNETQYFQNAVESACDMWWDALFYNLNGTSTSNRTYFNAEKVDSGNKITIYWQQMDDDGDLGTTDLRYANATHYTAGVVIEINRAALNANTGCLKSYLLEVTIAHEIGHALGLEDLDTAQTSMYNQLMGYGWQFRGAEYIASHTYPDPEDIQGANVILGFHTNVQHSFNYTYVNLSTHSRVCGLCHGWNNGLPHVEGTSPQGLLICLQCGAYLS